MIPAEKKESMTSQKFPSGEQFEPNVDRLFRCRRVNGGFIEQTESKERPLGNPKEKSTQRGIFSLGKM